MPIYELWVSIFSPCEISFPEIVNLSVPIRFVDAGTNLSFFELLMLLFLDLVLFS